MHRFSHPQICLICVKNFNKLKPQNEHVEQLLNFQNLKEQKLCISQQAGFCLKLNFCTEQSFESLSTVAEAKPYGRHSHGIIALLRCTSADENLAKVNC